MRRHRNDGRKDPPHDAAGWTLTEYWGRSGLAQLEGAWRSLYARMPERSFFQSYDALLAYVDTVDEHPDELRCLLLCHGQRPEAICLLRRQEHSRLGVSWREWSLPRLPHTRTAEVICPEDGTRIRLLREVVSHLRHDARPLPVLRLGPLPAGSPLWKGLPAYGRLGAFSRNGRGMHVFDAEVSADEAMARLSKSTRHGIRRAKRKLAGLDDAIFSTVTSPDQLAAALDTFVSLESSGWKADSGQPIASRHDLLEFYRSLTRIRAGADRCEIHMLHAGDRCIAAEFGVRVGGDYSALKIAYDEEYAEYSPGVLIAQYSLERCCADPGIRQANWISDESWQERWRPERVSLQTGYVALSPCAGRALIACLRLKSGPWRRLRERARSAVARRKA
jgi:hypothetical protein